MWCRFLRWQIYFFLICLVVSISFNVYQYKAYSKAIDMLTRCVNTEFKHQVEKKNVDSYIKESVEQSTKPPLLQ